MDNEQYKRALNSAYNRVQNQWPRLLVMIILGLTGVSAFLTSALLLRLGMTPMVVRYPVAIAAAYGVFIMLIGLWLWLQRQEPDMDDLTEGVLDGAMRNVDMTSASGGGNQLADISGGGWSAGAPTPATSGGGSSSIDLPGVDVDLDLDDLIWVVLAIVVLIAGLLAIFYIVYIAPVLLTEVLVDGLLAAGLYKTVKRAEGRHWMMTVVRKTAIPAALAMIFFAIAGFCVQKIEPKASSIGEAWRLMSR
jgi:hypothetical protein